MKELFQHYWAEAIFAGFMAAMTLIVKSLYGKLKQNQMEQCLIKEGVLAILHDRLYQNCHSHIIQGYCSLEDRVNLEYMFKAYHGLGGNGTCQNIYETCCELPYTKPETPKAVRTTEKKRAVS